MSTWHGATPVLSLATYLFIVLPCRQSLSLHASYFNSNLSACTLLRSSFHSTLQRIHWLSLRVPCACTLNFLTTLVYKFYKWCSLCFRGCTFHMFDASFLNTNILTRVMRCCHSKELWIVHIPHNTLPKTYRFSHTLYMCCMWLLQSTADSSLSTIIELIFTTGKESTFCDMGLSDFVYTLETNGHTICIF